MVRIPFTLPSSADQLENALRLHRSGQLAAAANAYRSILALEPNHSDALNLLGLALQAGGDHAQAVQSFERAVKASPKVASYLLNLGGSLRALGRHQEAVEAYGRAVEAGPTLAEAHHQLGNALKALQRYAEAADSLRRAVSLEPKNAVVWLNLGAALLELSQRNEAIGCFEKAVALEPSRPEAYNILGSALLDAGRIGAAKIRLYEALRLRPAYPAAHDNLGRALRAEGRAAEALAEFRAALSAKPHPGTHSNLLYALNFVPGLSPAEMLREHINWAALHAAPLAGQRREFLNTKEAKRRLRVGYVSPDFAHHAVAYFFEPVLSAHNRAYFEVFCYSNVAVADHVTARLRGLAGQWRDISGLTDDQAALLIREDRIDILVDLSGHTARHRLLVFARKPAPVQVTWLGYPNTTGLTEMDARITDATCDPAGRTDEFYTEKLLRLPDGFSCYRPPEEAPEVTAPPALKNGYITFGCFNHFAKINPDVLELWARLLSRLPASRLLLKTRSLADDATMERVRAFFAERGVSGERVMLRSDELSVAAHLGLYGEMDIALDTFPYNGTTTTCEALWMGVPVVTLMGRSHVERVTASILTQLGRTEWIAHSADEYIARCSELASVAQDLVDMRKTQRERMRTSPVCSAERFTLNLEMAYRALWSRWCEDGS